MGLMLMPIQSPPAGLVVGVEQDQLETEASTQVRPQLRYGP
jgi:hypothetical protein